MRLLAQVKNDLDGLVREADARLFSGSSTTSHPATATTTAPAAAAAYAYYDEEDEEDDDEGECGPPLPRPYVPTAAAAASSPALAARGARLSTGSSGGATAVQWTKGLWSPLLASSRPARSAEEGEVEVEKGEEDRDGGYYDTGAGAPLPAAATTAAATQRRKQKRRQSWPSPLRSGSSHSSPLMAAAGATPPPAGAAAAAATTTTTTTSPLLAKGQALPPIEALCGPAAARALAAEERALSLVFSRWVGGCVGLWGGIDVTSVWSCA